MIEAQQSMDISVLRRKPQEMTLVFPADLDKKVQNVSGSAFILEFFIRLNGEDRYFIYFQLLIG